MLGWYREILRNIDRVVLLPAIWRQSGSDEQARRAIKLHLSADYAWRYPEEWCKEESPFSPPKGFRRE